MLPWFSVWFGDELLGKYQAHSAKEACKAWVDAHPYHTTYSAEDFDAFPCNPPDERD